MSKNKRKKAERQNTGNLRIRRKILSLVVFISILIIAFIIIIMNLPEEKMEFQFSKQSGQWLASPGTTVRLEDSAANLINREAALCVVVPNLNIDADLYDVCILEMTTPIAFDQGKLLFLSPYNKEYNINFSLSFDTGRSNRSNKILVDFKKHGAWRGIIREVLLIPSVTSMKVSLKSLKFVHANPLTKLLALWSDFTRYYDPTLATCFAMVSPVFMGKSYNALFIPFLWIIFALSAVVFFLNLRIRKAAIGAFFLFFLLFWGLLDLRNNIYYTKAILRDANLYWGKTLIEKRGIAVGDPRFINFMKFCDESIPMDGRVINCVPQYPGGTPFIYLSATQVNFNLRPRLNVSGKPYYIFYNNPTTEVDGVVVNDLKMFKRYDERAFILTR